tara:strand:+ start:166 stop:285 length:120 start_codon:yes stop_codon:yes gene_type:complete
MLHDGPPHKSNYGYAYKKLLENIDEFDFTVIKTGISQTV